MTTTSRREFLFTAGAAALAFGGVRRLLAMGDGAVEAEAASEAFGFGDLVPDPDGLLDLPPGFRYQIISRAGEKMDDGLLVPGKADGMAAFAGPDGSTILVRNHEVSVRDTRNGAFGDRDELAARVDRARFYDAGVGGPALGGTSTVVYDTNGQRRLRQFLSLAGTTRNCAGGPTPWGSWLTCEEDVTRAGQNGAAADHGYVFEVSATAEPSLAEPRPIRGMGRFNHEAVCVHPASGVVYLTEDRGDGLLYRFVPRTPGDLHAGGRLEALRVKGRPSLDTRNWSGDRISPGEALEVEWMPLEDIEPAADDLRQRGFEAGAARFARGEGAWWGNDAAWFVCTNGGEARKGQVWRYDPSPAEGAPGEPAQPGRLTLFVEPNDGAVVDMPDNICVAPWGDLVLCEDGRGEQFMVGVTPEGRLYKLAKNARNSSEFAGSCFSPDGGTLFVNIQHDGLTLAITGPWRG